MATTLDHIHALEVEDTELIPGSLIVAVQHNAWDPLADEVEQELRRKEIAEHYAAGRCAA